MENKQFTDEQFFWIKEQLKGIRESQDKMIQIHLDRAKKELGNE